MNQRQRELMQELGLVLKDMQKEALYDDSFHDELSKIKVNDIEETYLAIDQLMKGRN